MRTARTGPAGAREVVTELNGAEEARAGQTGAATFRGLAASPQFMVLIGGFALYGMAVAVTALGLSVLVYQRTGSALLSGLGLAAESLPYLIGATFLLAHADRVPPRPGLAGVGVAQVAVLALLASGWLPVAAMLAVTFGLGVVLPIGTAIRSALLPELLRPGLYVLGRAVLNVTGYVTQVVGYALGGTLLVVLGARATLWVAAGLALGAVVVHWVGLRARAARGPGQGAAWRQTWRVNRRLLGDGRIRRLLLAHWLPLAAIAGPEAALVPYAAGHGEAALAGGLLWAVAAGNLVGDLTVGRYVPVGRQERLVLPLALLMGVPLLGFAARPGLAGAAGLCFVASTGVAYQLGLQRRFLDAVPEEVRGQAFGLLVTGITTVQSLAVAVAAALAEALGPGTVVVVFGGVTVAIALTLTRLLRHNP
ncbi:MFS transporter [Dactylosporangium sp. NPDC051485]|uniref:MFS transporter n=1 Tax=Dactylosporangium sp. NPDC051485 TaxID=3154846 RepID=UPI003435F8EF